MKKFIMLVFLTVLPAYAQNIQIKISQEQIDNLNISVGPLTSSRLIPLFYAPAKVVVPGNHELLISSNQPGVVIQLTANIGDPVQKGKILAKINSPELVALQREFLTTGNELNLSDLEYRRDQRLLQDGVIADRRWQETAALHSSKAAQYETARQLLLMAGMTLKEINELAKSHKPDSVLSIRSPINGVVLERLATLGTRLDMQTPLYRIADVSELWLEINIPEERLSQMRVGDHARVESAPVTATISVIGQSVNRDNQTVIVRAKIEGRQSSLRAGQTVNVQILRQSEHTDFTVPNTAISQNEGHSYVFVRNTDGFFVTEVEVLGKQDNQSLIRARLSGNELIAIKGAVALKADWLGLGSNEQ